jgi:N-acetylmuramoyl-L-alanine amidase
MSPLARSSLVLSIGVALACGACSRDRHGVWPEEGSSVSVVPYRIPDGFGSRKIVVDPGHGAPGNKGNVSAWCQDEQDFTLSIARHLAATLQATGHFEVRLTRQTSDVPYPARVREAEEWGADAFVSLHSDVRGAAEPWSPREGAVCYWTDQAPGFAVLYSDEAEPQAVARRLRLATAVAAKLSAAGFPPYDGAGYTRSYAPAQPGLGVFVDRHPPDKRIYVLRYPSMPAILVETHNALHRREAARFEEDATRQAFDAAVAAALVEALGRSEEGSRREE